MTWEGRVLKGICLASSERSSQGKRKGEENEEADPRITLFWDKQTEHI